MRSYNGNEGNGGNGNGSMVAHESANFGSVLNTNEEPIRLLFVGDVGVGKSTFIQTYIEDAYVENIVPSVVEPIQFDSRLGKIEFHDSGEDVAQSQDTLHRQIEDIRPHLVVLCFVMDDTYVMQRLEQYWLPALESCPLQARVMLLALKQDAGLGSPGVSGTEGSGDSDSGGHSAHFEELTNRYMQDFKCVALGTWACASASVESVGEAVLAMAYMVCFPNHPLFDEDLGVPTPEFQRAIARIFRCLDSDHDGILRPSDIAFQQNQVFGLSLGDTSQVEPIIDAVAFRDPGGVAANPKGLYEDGFCTMHTEHVLEGQSDPAWAVLKCFHYDYEYALNRSSNQDYRTQARQREDCARPDELHLATPLEYLTYPIPLHFDQCLTLSPAGRSFIVDLFNLYAQDGNDIDAHHLQHGTTTPSLLTPSAIDRIFCTLKHGTKDNNGGRVTGNMSEVSDYVVYGDRGHPFGAEFPWNVSHGTLPPQTAQQDHMRALDIAGTYDTGYAVEAGRLQRRVDRIKDKLEQRQRRLDRARKHLESREQGATSYESDVANGEENPSELDDKSFSRLSVDELRSLEASLVSECEELSQEQERAEHEAEQAANDLPVRRWCLTLGNWLGLWEMLASTQPAVALKCMYQLGFATAVPKETLANALEDIRSHQEEVSLLQGPSAIVQKIRGAEDDVGVHPGVIRVSDPSAPNNNHVGPLSPAQILALSQQHEHMPRLTLNPSPAFAPSIRKKSEKILQNVQVSAKLSFPRGSQFSVVDVFGGSVASNAGMRRDTSTGSWLGLLGSFGQPVGELPPLGNGPTRRIFVMGSKGCGKTTLSLHALHQRDMLGRYHEEQSGSPRHCVMVAPEVDEQKEKEASRDNNQSWEERRLELALYPAYLVITEWAESEMNTALDQAASQCDVLTLVVDPASSDSVEFVRSVISAVPDSVPTTIVLSQRDENARNAELEEYIDSLEVEQFEFRPYGNASISRSRMMRGFWKYVGHLSLHPSWDNPMTDERREAIEKAKWLYRIRLGSAMIAASLMAGGVGYFVYKNRDSVQQFLKDTRNFVSTTVNRIIGGRS
eukprot:gb/GECG01000599.1/.p1 GENE.gb/GECG01000599.1/~~gb/GECG01000599.1/.p1  ORF type:complete len:1066 (+),score=107.70 gb/GECG01000599.1/:1-3198(+)